MHRRPRLSRNALASAAQLIAGSLAVFAVYRYLSAELGVGALGVWSLVLAMASASRIADLGLSVCVTRFVATALARGDMLQAATFVETGILSLAFAMATLLPLAYMLGSYVLVQLFSGALLDEALATLPYALATLWLMVIGALVLSALDGCQRVVARSGIMIVGYCLFAGTTVLLVPRFGLVGVALAQMGHAITILLVGYGVLRQDLESLGIIPRRWRASTLKEMMKFSIGVQCGAALAIAVDPIVKVLLVTFGGAASAGYFEVANQIAMRVRSLIVAANQVIMPRVAELTVKGGGDTRVLYVWNLRIVSIAAAGTIMMLLLGAPLLSFVLFRQHQEQFVLFLEICGAGWVVNMISAPAYFFNLGQGAVWRNVFGHAITGATCAVMGWLLGSQFGPVGVVAAYAFAIAAGAFFVIMNYHVRKGHCWREVFAGV